MKFKLIISFLMVGASIAAKTPDSSNFGTAFQDLAGDDQARFVAMVNRSMAKESEPLDEKSIVTLYRVNRDAIKASPAIDRKQVLATVFATAPKECLPYFTDNLAKELFTRKAAGFGKNDDSFMEFASAALLRISQVLHVLKPYELPGVRSAFAVIMFIKAAEGTPEDLRETFMLYVLSGSHEITRKVWFPAAFGDDNRPPSYKPMLEAMEKGEEPPHNVQLQVALPQRPVWLRGELNVKDNAVDVSGPGVADGMHGLPMNADGQDLGLSRVPRGAVSDKDSPYYRSDRDNPYHKRDDEPGGYFGQTF